MEAEDLIHRVEETFGISITPEDVTGLYTVTDLHQLIMQKVNGKVWPACLTAHVFYRLRRALMEQGNVPRHAITPKTTLDQLIPPVNHKAHWKHLRTSVRLDFPPPSRPETVRVVMTWIFWIGTVALILSGCNDLIPLTDALLGLAAVWGTTYLIYVFSKPWLVYFEPGLTVGALAQQVLVENHQVLGAAPATWSRHAVWERVQLIIAHELGLPIHEIMPQARLVDDLHID